MVTINPYLNFPGTTEEAFNFYKSVLNGEIIGLQRFKDTPEATKLPAHEQEKMMHMSIAFGKGNLLMATDALESMGHKVTAGTNFHLTVNTESKDEANRVFKGLAAGGQITMPIEDMFWGAYFGMLTDKFGIQWMVTCDPNQPK
jgi:PhnB protein